MGLPEVSFAGAIILTNALVQLVKLVDKLSKLENFTPLIAELIGFGVGMGIGLGWFNSLFVGLSAMGLYSGIKYSAEKLL